MLLEKSREIAPEGMKRLGQRGNNTQGISELKWTGMGEFNSDDHISMTVGKNPLEEME